MPNVTASLSDDTAKRLRKVVREVHNSRKGAPSGLVEEAVKDTLDKLELPGEVVRFRAVKDDATVAEADSLAELASILRQKRIEPRSVRILSRPAAAPLARAGLRVRSR